MIGLLNDREKDNLFAFFLYKDAFRALVIWKEKIVSDHFVLKTNHQKVRVTVPINRNGSVTVCEVRRKSGG